MATVTTNSCAAGAWCCRLQPHLHCLVRAPIDAHNMPKYCILNLHPTAFLTLLPTAAGPSLYNL
jgi:hypothetical protein